MTSKYTKKKIDKTTGKKKTPMIIMSNCYREQAKHKIKWSKDTEELNNTINNIDMMEIDVTLYPTTAEYTLFLIMYRMFTKIDHTQANFKKFQRMFSHQNWVS